MSSSSSSSSNGEKFLEIFANVDEYKQVNILFFGDYQKEIKLILDDLFQGHGSDSNIQSIIDGKFRSINEE